MKANIEKVFEVNQPINKVWAYLSNPEKVVTCVPRAQLTEKVDETNYKGKVSMKFGPVSAKYDGAITIDKLDEANHHMTITGTGMDAKGKGSAGMTMNGKLVSKEANLTEVSYTMEVSVTGKLAQFGSRLIVDVSDQLAEQFINKFKTELEAEPSVTEEAPASSVLTGGVNTPTEPSVAASSDDNSLSIFTVIGAIIKGFFGRLFGSSKS